MSVSPSETAPALELPGVDDFVRGYAELAVRVGANVQPGQHVVVMGRPEHAAYSRAVVAAAFDAGAADVEVLYRDELVSLLRAGRAADDRLDRAGASRVGLYEWMLDAQTAEIWLDVDDYPALWATVDGERAARVYRPKEIVPLRRRLISERLMAWTLLAVPSAGWAESVFGEPDVARLRAAVASAVRLDRPDPVAAWREHLDRLAERAAQLDERRFDAVRFRGPRTDLTVGLIEGSRWIGGASETAWGQAHCVNLPTEEVFTTPDWRRTQGTVRSTRPVSYGGVVLDEVELRFENGRATLVGAAGGEEFVRGELGKDEHAAYLGEVALVAGDSPVARSGLLYYNPLYDENVASHIAYGTGYSAPVPGTDELTPDERRERGVNQSTVHTDLPIGGAGVEVTGLDRHGNATPILDGVDWVLS